MKFFAKITSSSRTFFHRRCVGRVRFLWLAFFLPLVHPLGAETEAVVDLGRRLLESRGQANRGAIARHYMLACMAAGKYSQGVDVLAEFLTGEGAEIRTATLSTPRLNALLTAADALVLLDRGRREGMGDIRSETLAWLFAADARLGMVVENLSPDDDWPAVLTIVETLATHDPRHRDVFLPLILAMAVVWDQPRPPLHHQIGRFALPYQPELTKRYDYFKRLYADPRAKFRFDRLSISALSLVVDTPVPVAELEWAQNHVRGTLGNWGRKFRQISYDTGRLERGQYTWNAGPYTLATIEKTGGICVDQAYYTTLSARAHGIPAMIFTGVGRRGPHAWSGYMKSETSWEMDVGRYDYDNYATGHTIDPRSNRRMTDHAVEFECSRALNSPAAATAAQYARIAEIFARLAAWEAAYAFARRATETAPLHEPPWRVMEFILRERGDDRERLRLLERKATVFQRFPDFFAEIRVAQAEVLRQLGREAEADRLLNVLESRLGGGREDLSGAISQGRIAEMLAAGNPQGARARMESLLRDQRREGKKVFPLIQAYLELTKGSGQEREALRFLRTYLGRVQVDERGKAALREFEIQAYLNAGDERGADRLRRRR